MSPGTTTRFDFPRQKCANILEFREVHRLRAHAIKELIGHETSLIVGPTFTIPGFCEVCEIESNFAVDLEYGGTAGDTPRPNWRERLVCVHCGLNNRLRATLSLMKQRAGKRTGVFITEEGTPASRKAKDLFVDPFCSNCLTTRSFHVEPGQTIYESKEFRRLKESRFDVVASFDRLSGPINSKNYILAQIARYIAPGGKLFLTTPLDLSREKDRALKIEGPPYDWNLIDFLRVIGFNDAAVELYWSDTLAYLGFPQMVITATYRLSQSSPHTA